MPDIFNPCKVVNIILEHLDVCLMAILGSCRENEKVLGGNWLAQVRHHTCSGPLVSTQVLTSGLSMTKKKAIMQGNQQAMNMVTTMVLLPALISPPHLVTGSSAGWGLVSPKSSQIWYHTSFQHLLMTGALSLLTCDKKFLEATNFTTMKVHHYLFKQSSDEGKESDHQG